MSTTASKVFRFGIIGCGAIGPTHAGAIRQLGHVVHAVADPMASRVAKVAEQTPGAKTYRDHAMLLEDADVDIVCICTPSGMHADHAIAALRAGKHVIIEKPMDVTTAACDQIIAAAEENKRHVTVISQHRFDAAAILARKLIDSGELGRIILATADVKWWRKQQYYDEGEWRGTWKYDGGGALMNQGVHTVDVLQWLAGGVKEVSAIVRTAAHERIEVEDIAVLSLQFQNGAVGSLVASTAAFDGQPVRIELHGTKGSILLEGDNLKRVTLTNGQKYDSQAAAEHAIRVAQGGTASVRDDAVSRPAADHGAAWGDAHRAQFQDFIRAIIENRTPSIDGRQGRLPVAVITAAYESARKNGAWVEVR